MNAQPGSRPVLLLLLAVLSLGRVVHAQSATLVADAPLQQRPSSASPVLKQLNAGMRVEQLSRTGGWKQVSTGDTTGWVRSYLVRNGSITVSEKPSDSGFLGALAALSRKASGLFSSDRPQGISTRLTATIGIRGRNVAAAQTDTGLTPGHFAGARPDWQGLNKLEGLRSSPRDARQFAGEGGRKQVPVAHLPPTEAER